MQKTHQSEQKSIHNCSTQVSHHIAQDQNIDFETIRKHTHKPLTNRSMAATHKAHPHNLRRSLNQHKKAVPLQQSNPSFFSKKQDSSRRSAQPCETGELRLQEFQCPLCLAQGTAGCHFCQGNNIITKESALIRFLSYVIDFKLGKNDSYLQESLKETARSSSSLKSTQMSRMSLAERKNECVNIHYGYFCNACNNEQPIRGSRFCCEICEDYDLCEPCYSERGHKHIMREIKRSPSYSHSLRCLEKIEQKSQLATAKKMKNLSVRIRVVQQKLQTSYR